MKTTISASLLVLVLLVPSCKKANTVYLLQDSFKGWALFQKNSYWVFLNEKSHLPDSMYIIESPYSWFQPMQNGKYQYEVIDYKFSNGFLLSAEIKAANDYYAVLGLQDFNGWNTVLSSAVVDNLTNLLASGDVIERLDSIIVNNNKFTNVIHIKDTIQKKEYYFAKNIGLFKFSKQIKNTDSVWSILRWHVIQ
jgi:hypothetical protein